VRAGRAAWLLAALAPAAAADEGVRFGRDVVPILNRACISCHLEGGELGGLALYPDPWARLVGVASTQSALKLVEPGDPGKSYLHAKLAGTHAGAGGSGLRMPPQSPPLADADIETLRRWIAAGAKND
jgi:mono/diheme cytochrome c family protein